MGTVLSAPAVKIGLAAAATIGLASYAYSQSDNSHKKSYGYERAYQEPRSNSNSYNSNTYSHFKSKKMNPEKSSKPEKKVETEKKSSKDDRSNKSYNFYSSTYHWSTSENISRRTEHFSSSLSNQDKEETSYYYIQSPGFKQLTCCECDKILTHETFPYSPEHLNIHYLAYKHSKYINSTKSETSRPLYCYICGEPNIVKLGFIHNDENYALVVCKNCLTLNVKSKYIDSYSPFYVPYTKVRDSMSDYYNDYDYLIENDQAFSNYVEKMNMIIQSDIDSNIKKSEKVNKVQVSITFSNSYLYTINIDSRLSHFAKQLILHSTVLCIKNDKKVICSVNSIDKKTIILTGNCPFDIKVTEAKQNTFVCGTLMLDCIYAIKSSVISDRQKAAIKKINSNKLYKCLVDPRQICCSKNIFLRDYVDCISLRSVGIGDLVENIMKEERNNIKEQYKFSNYMILEIMNMMNQTISIYDSATVIKPLLLLLYEIQRSYLDAHILICCADNNSCDLFTIALNAYGFKTLRQMAYSRTNETSKYGDFSQFCSGRQAIDYYKQHFNEYQDKIVSSIKNKIYVLLDLDFKLKYTVIEEFFDLFKYDRTASSIKKFATENYNILITILKVLPLEIDTKLLNKLSSDSNSTNAKLKQEVIDQLCGILRILFHQLDYELSKKKENELDYIENYLLSTNKIVLSTLISAGSSVFEGCTFDKVIIINAHLCREVDCLIPIQYNCDHLFIFDNKRKREALNEKQGNVPSEYIIGNRLLEYIEYSNSVKK